MPWKVEQRNNKWLVIKESDGSVAGEHASKEKADAQLRALFANENKAIDDLAILDPVYAVKSIGRDEIHGYLALWGDADKTDIERDFFTRSTNFWDMQMKGITRPLTWDHAQDPATKDSPIIGAIKEMGDDDTGRWYTAQLDRAHRYRKAIDKLIASGVLGTSSDSAPQYVIREKAKSGAYWLKQWPLFAAALTTTPCEPRQIGSVDYFKGLGVMLPVEPEDQQGAGRLNAENARRRIQLLKFFTGD